jgi:glycosyltransferase involved in cell wall biosynthesis
LISAAARHHRNEFEFDALYLLQWNNKLAPELAAAGIRVDTIGVNTVADLRWPLRLRRLVSAGKYDVVHAHSPVVASALRILLRTMPRRKRPKLVVTEHASWRSYRRLTRVANRATIGLDDVHIAVSEDARRAMPRRYQARTRVVVHGVLVDELQHLRVERDLVREELGIADDDVAIMAVANLVAEKNYPDLLRAARAVIDSGAPARFFAAGAGYMEDELKQLHAELDLGDRFVFLGYRSDAVRLLSGADIFALASSFEGYPVAVMEALVIGLPVVATEVGGVPDAIRSGVEGVIIPPHDPASLAQALIELANAPEKRAAMAAAATERSVQYDMSRAVDAIEGVYRELLADKARA